MTLFNLMNELDIHSISILQSKMGSSEGELIVTVEQGFIDATKCRSRISHCFHASSMEEIEDIMLARAKAHYHIGVISPVKKKNRRVR